MSLVVSFPRAPDQFLPRDTKAIFGDDYTVDIDIPPYAITMLIPLVDCTLETGCTRVWPKSHLTKTDDEAQKVGSIDSEVNVGSVLITNSKLLHRGGVNQSKIIRPLLYLIYQRSWLRDFAGYEERPPVTIGNRELEKVPGEYRHMFTWTKDLYRVIRIKNWLRRVLPGSLRQLRRG
ncbi:phytanoyl-CoA dioxygenase family protein [Sneathiella sp.]|uniref:phytanoyl-CoA dioxygenase family protein n=1 Tax=Sneathiella sp. TaxID=1964365 RepID=UPI00356B56CA